VNIDSQIATVKAAQGALPGERRMLGEAFFGSPAPTSSPGMNTTMQLELAGGAIVFHKPFSGVDVANAIAFGQTDETPPLHEAVAWRLAAPRGRRSSHHVCFVTTPAKTARFRYRRVDGHAMPRRADGAERWARLQPFAYRSGDLNIKVTEVAAVEPVAASFHYSTAG
jgi:hypothetical protein